MFKNQESYKERCKITKECLTSKKDMVEFINEILLDRYVTNNAYYNLSKAPRVRSLLFADLNIKDRFGGNALFESDFKMTKYLIKKGLDVNTLNDSMENALFYSVSKEKTEFLIDFGINIHQTNFRGENALFYCTDKLKLECLIKAGVDVNKKNNSGRTPLFSYNDIDKIEMLINAGADINIKDNYGKTLLECFSLDICKNLIKKGIDLSGYPDNEIELSKIFKREHFKENLIDIIIEEKINREKKVITSHINKINNPVLFPKVRL